MAARLTLLLTSPRVAAGLLTRDAWQVLAAASQRLAADLDDPQPAAIRDAGVPVVAVPPQSPAGLARHLVEATGSGDLVWVGSPDGDPGLTDALAAEVTRMQVPPEVEVLVGSWDVPGARLLDLVAVMDRLRSPDGCPWDAEQTHQSLVPYLIEEAHEAVEAIESGDRAHMTEELGDLLLQVVFHARVAEEDPAAPFDVDDVAAGIVAKLVRRHPHVFADVAAADADAVAVNWERIKAAEKPHRTRPLEGIPAGMPPLSRADKVADRLERAGHVDLLAQAADPEPGAAPAEEVGARLLRVVLEARGLGVDPAAALRRTLRDLEARLP